MVRYTRHRNICISFTTILSARILEGSRLPAYLRARKRPHTNFLLGLTVPLYLLAVACWSIDIALLRQDLLVLLPSQISDDPDLDVYMSLAELRAAEQYAQAILQVIIVRLS